MDGSGSLRVLSGQAVRSLTNGRGVATAMIFCLIFVVPSLDSSPLFDIFVEDLLFKGFLSVWDATTIG